MAHIGVVIFLRGQDERAGIIDLRLGAGCGQQEKGEGEQKGFHFPPHSPETLSLGRVDSRDAPDAPDARHEPEPFWNPTRYA
jgi:hypothetical protein